MLRRFWPPREPFRASSLIVLVLVASTLIAVALAAQAIAAARQRRAISDAMLRQYAQLAGWEFARQARRDVEQALAQALAGYAHPERARHASDASCGCLAAADVEHWFEVTAAGELRTGPSFLREARWLSGVADGGSSSEGSVRIMAHEGDPARLVATRAEPHLAGGGQVGLVVTARALVPILKRALDRASLLPPVLTGDRDARSLVDLRLATGDGNVLFASDRTTAGPQVVTTPIWPDHNVPLTAAVSMTPAFVAGLGPEHGSGPGSTFVITLVAVNALLVGVGLVQLRRERELARLRSDFVAGVSHELRTPLAQIRMFSETLLLERIRSADEGRRALEIIGQESTRLTQLVDNVLHFHRGTRLAVSAGTDTVELNAFTAAVVDSFRPLAASRKAHVAIIEAPEPLVVRGDAGGFRQVLLNLLDNAIKFGPVGQTVTVRLAARDEFAVLMVDDAGAGVALPDRTRIFDAFERGRERNGTGGAGIGLAVVRQIVDAHRGTAVADEAPGGGARFTIALPRDTAPGEPAAPSSPA